jgi:archaemetzincin
MLSTLALLGICVVACVAHESGGGAVGDDGGTQHQAETASTPAADVPDWAKDRWGDFAPLPTPGPGDWLDVHHEPGQSFENHVRSRPTRPDNARAALVLQPLGDLAAADGPSPGTLRRFTETFFGLDTRVNPPAIEPISADITSRADPHFGRRQLLTGDLLDLLRRKLPEDAFCMLGITMEDLYPADSWNYVFGQASLRDRVAVYSFARYRPEFWGESSEDSSLLLRRSCKVLAHETAHAFGIRHCTAYNCLMNGSNHLEESDSRPLHLCPVDLRKLQWSIGFDVADRYRRLSELYRELGLDDAAAWTKRRLGHIGTL